MLQVRGCYRSEGATGQRVYRSEGATGQRGEGGEVKRCKLSWWHAKGIRDMQRFHVILFLG